VSAWETSGQSDKWYTPKYIFDAMGGVMFDLDVCRAERTVRATFLAARGSAATAYSTRLARFRLDEPALRRAQRAGAVAGEIHRPRQRDLHRARPDKRPVVSSGPRRAWMARCSYRRRLQFERPDGSLGKSPGAGSVLFYVGPQGRRHVEVAKALGWLALPVVA
jgi:hypothetical protein